MADNVAQQVAVLVHEGTAAFRKAYYGPAVTYFTQALAISQNHKPEMIYNARSLTYLRMKKYKEALEDGEQAIKCKRTWSKGYLRKGQVLMEMEKYEEALMTLMEGFDKDPHDNALKKTINDCRIKIQGPNAENRPLVNPFADLKLWEKIEKNPMTRQFLLQPDYRQIVQHLQKNPQDLGKHLEDARIMTTVGMLLDVDIEAPIEASGSTLSSGMPHELMSAATSAGDGPVPGNFMAELLRRQVGKTSKPGPTITELPDDYEEPKRGPQITELPDDYEEPEKEGETGGGQKKRRRKRGKKGGAGQQQQGGEEEKLKEGSSGVGQNNDCPGLQGQDGKGGQKGKAQGQQGKGQGQQGKGQVQQGKGQGQQGKGQGQQGKGQGQQGKGQGQQGKGQGQEGKGPGQQRQDQGHPGQGQNPQGKGKGQGKGQKGKGQGQMRKGNGSQGTGQEKGQDQLREEAEEKGPGKDQGHQDVEGQVDQKCETGAGAGAEAVMDDDEVMEINLDDVQPIYHTKTENTQPTVADGYKAENTQPTVADAYNYKAENTQPTVTAQENSETHTEPTVPEVQPDKEPVFEKVKVDKQSPADLIKAIKEKDLGNAAYKKREFDSAIEHYDKAIELDPINIAIRTNKAAVFFEQQKFDECVTECEKAVEIGRENRADFKLIAKAFARMANAYVKKDDLDNGLKFYEKSISEHRVGDYVKKANEIKKQIAERERLKYINPEKSLEEKKKGNEFFTKGDYPTAIKFYTEAIKRNPEDAKLYSNRAACYTKLAEFHMSLKDSDECIRLDPTFVKGYLRKAGSYLAMKDISKAKSTYQKAMEMDPNCQEAIDGYRKCSYQENDPEAVQQRVMNDPEIRQILQDPGMQTILSQMQSDPNAVREHLKDPVIATKIQKLVDSGLIGMRPM